MTQITTRSYDGFTWIDCHDVSIEDLQEVIESYQLHLPLVKDALQPGHLPKYEAYDNGQFLILRAYTAHEDDIINNIQQLSDKIAFFVNEHYLISFHKHSFEFLNLQPNPFNSSYHLLFYLIRLIFKTYNNPATWHSNEIDVIEKMLFTEKLNRISLEDLYFQKLEIRLTKKLLMFSQNVLQLLKSPETVKSEHQDAKEVLVQLILEYEEAADDANALTNTYLSLNSKKNNDVMKLLTIFSAFFLPLTFIAGVYGMNFDNMPELHTPNGYFFTLLLMLVISIIIWIWFKRKRIL
ncbi:MAG: CorA family divalent cation transporter [Flavobacteriaceae bacterium]|nr:CorA family divalent cation transporter [Flavobacteriaceae bacterium]